MKLRPADVDLISAGEIWGKVARGGVGVISAHPPTHQIVRAGESGGDHPAI
jgi:hypothetical protein